MGKSLELWEKEGALDRGNFVPILRKSYASVSKDGGFQIIQIYATDVSAAFPRNSRRRLNFFEYLL